MQEQELLGVPSHNLLPSFVIVVPLVGLATKAQIIKLQQKRMGIAGYYVIVNLCIVMVCYIMFQTKQ